MSKTQGVSLPLVLVLALHYWRALVGGSEFALRALSSVGGLGHVPVHRMP